jgi:hypothetical protein
MATPGSKTTDDVTALRREAAFGHKLWMKEAINHRHDEGDDGDGDHKHHQAAPCPHFLVVRQSSSASRLTAGAFGKSSPLIFLSR